MDEYGNLLDVTVTVALCSAFSAIVAAALTAKLNHLYNHQIKMVEYRNAYYQKLIEKRLAALDDLKVFLSLIQQVVYLTDTGKNVREIYYPSPSVYMRTAKRFSELFGHEMWLSDKTREKFILFRDVFSDVHQEIVKRKFDVNFIFAIGIQNEDIIYNAAKDLYMALSEEYFHVHDIEQLKTVYKELRLPIPEWFPGRKKQALPVQRPQIQIPALPDKSEKTE